jgi:hypothetical protein
VRLYDDQTDENLGEVSPVDVQFLIDQLEEEYDEDRAYYINQDTITLLRSEGATQELLSLLERAVARTGEAEVRWGED